jgi:phosphoesterase RecJ-like protein
MWSEFKKLIDRYQHFVLSTHLNPDGDGLGSELALASLLRSLNKEATIVNPSETPKNYRFMDPDGEICCYPGQAASRAINRGEVLILLDCGSLKRLGELGDHFKTRKVFRACIDHHLTVDDGFELAIVREEAAATAMLIFDLIVALKGNVNQKEAWALYTAIMRETGSFRFANTDSEVHRVIAQLLEHGIDTQKVYEEVYERNSPARLRFLGHLLTELELDEGGRLVWITATRALLDRYQVTEADMDGFIDYPRSLDRAELVLFFIEKEGQVRVSFRSKGSLDVNKLANSFGGGGHKNAAGATLAGGLDEAKEQVIAAARAYLTGQYQGD